MGNGPGLPSHHTDMRPVLVSHRFGNLDLLEGVVAMNFIIDIIIITMALFKIVMPIVVLFWLVGLVSRL